MTQFFLRFSLGRSPKQSMRFPVTIFAFALTMNGPTIAVPEGSADLTAFLDSVAVDAGYLALRDAGGSSDSGGGNDGNDLGQTDGLSPREKTGSQDSA